MSLVLFVGSFASADPLPDIAQTLSGIVRNEAGSPLVGAAVSLFLDHITDQPLTTTRSRRDGTFEIEGILPGNYILSVVKTGYAPVAERFLAPLAELPVLVVLRNAAASDPGGRNWDLETVMRSSTDRNLIFRVGESPPPTPPRPQPLKEAPNQDAVRAGQVQLTSTYPLGGDFNVLPRNIGSGLATRFAYVEPLGGSASFIVTGLMTTGVDSRFHLQNIVNYRLGQSHQVRLQLGYDKMGAARRPIHNLGAADPVTLHDEILQTIEPIQNLHLGIQDVFSISEPLQMVYGFDINYSTIKRGETFIRPRFQLLLTPTEDLAFRFQFNNERQTYYNTLSLPELGNINLHSPLQTAKLGDHPMLSHHQHAEAGVSFLLGERTSVEFSAFLDEVTGGSHPFVAILKNPAGNLTSTPHVPDKFNDGHGFRLGLSHHWTRAISTSVIYVYGRGTEFLPRSQDVDPSNLMDNGLNRRFFNQVTAMLEARLPESGTHVSAVYRVSDGNSLIPVDPYSDRFDLPGNSLSMFVRQPLPFFKSSLGTWEAILDIRNILNNGVDIIETPNGDLILVRSPRSFRGGISFRF